MYRLGIIGTGNMGRAIIGGVLKEGILKPGEIICYDRVREAMAKTVSEFGVSGAGSAPEVARSSDSILLAVKPQNLHEVGQELSGQAEGKLLVSILAGKRAEEVRDAVGGVRVVRAMPNTPCLVGKGVTGLYASPDVTEDERKFVLTLFNAVGKADYFEKEDLLDAVTAFTGSGPAYVSLLIEALADGAVLCGLPRSVANEFAPALVEGTAALIREKKIHPAVAKEMVMSPGGTTAEGVAVLEERGFRSSLIEAVRAAFEKCREL
ncbi:MAG: pyrroline-5-carboxylate reductase [Deltaproteobacteria bacterium]|nr:MAG: pyrroline-5-carboxylate reductase [Deltaproteobacteria bacterium]